MMPPTRTDASTAPVLSRPSEHRSGGPHRFSGHGASGKGPAGLASPARHRSSGQRGLNRASVAAPLLALVVAALPATAPAQSGPVGQSRAVPTQAYGAAGRPQAEARGDFRAPVDNWNHGSNRGFNSGFDARVGTPAAERRDDGSASPPAQTVAPAGRPGGRGNPTAPIDRRVTQGGNMAPVVATRVLKADEFDSIEHLQQLVQQGTMHETGFGASRDLVRAFDLYCEAAGQGYPEALVRMAWMYADGNGVEKSRAAAHTLFIRAKRFGFAQGGELAARFAGEAEVLPRCLRGTVVERGTIERPPTREELVAFSGRATSSLRATASNLSGERSRFAQIVLAESSRFKLDPRLVMAVMAAESGYDPNARSLKNAHGLMQLLPETAERFNVADINDPAQNIRGGMAYLRWLLAYFRGDVALTLAGYNAGEGAVDKHGGVPPYPETLAYVQRIRAAYPFDRHPYDPTAATTPSRTATAGGAGRPATADRTAPPGAPMALGNRADAASN